MCRSDLHRRGARPLALALLLLVFHRPAAGQAADAAAPGKPETMLGALSFSSSKEPIAVSADALEFDYKARVLVYKGNVVATQGDMKLEAERLTIALNAEGDNQLREVVAAGKVRLEKGTRFATAGRAVFDQIHRKVTLSENAVLQDGPNQVKGERVVGFLDEERWVVEGGTGRVHASFDPRSADATPEGNP